VSETLVEARDWGLGSKDAARPCQTGGSPPHILQKRGRGSFLGSAEQSAHRSGPSRSSTAALAEMLGVRLAAGDRPLPPC